MTAVRPDATDAGGAVWQLPDSDAPLRQLMLLRCAALMASQLPALLMQLSVRNIVPPLAANLMPLLVRYAIKTEQLLYWQAKSTGEYKNVTTLSSRVKEGFTYMTVEMFNVEEFELESGASHAAAAADTAAAGGASSGASSSGGSSSGPGSVQQAVAVNMANIAVSTLHSYNISCFCLCLELVQQ
jgi:hypothetical protein